MWKVLAESNEVISLEKRKRFVNVRIEARKNAKNKWDVFKTYVHKDKYNLVDEYTTSSRNEAEQLIGVLKREKDLSVTQIKNIKDMENKPLQLVMKRQYKEYEVEKWNFWLFNEKNDNTLIIRYAEKIVMDVALHHRYKTIVQRLIDEMVSMLGLKEFGVDMEYNIVLYDHILRKKQKNSTSLVFGKVEMGLND